MGLNFKNLARRAKRAFQERNELTFLELADQQIKDLTAGREDGKVELAKENVGPFLFTLNAGDSEDIHFQRITSPNTMRDLNPFMQLRMQQVCYYLVVTNPFAKQIVRMITAFIVGEGFRVHCEDKRTQAVVDRFWNDPINNLDSNVPQWTREKLVFGELCLPVAVNPIDGFVRLGYIDAQDIGSVRFGYLQTGNGRQELSIPTLVRLRSRTGDREERELAIIHRDEDSSSPTFGRLTGETFYFSINKAMMGSRGISELFALADWVDVLDQMVFDFADRVRFLSTFIWDATVNGATDKELREFEQKFSKDPPRQGGVKVHNEKVVLQAVTPDLKGADMGESVRVVKHYGCGGAGLPPHWMGDPNDANRAVAAEMDGPTGKVLTEHQNLVIRDVTEILKFVIGQAKQHGALEEDADEAFTLETPDLLMKDFAKGATILQGATNSLAIAEDRGWIRGETAARAFCNVLTQIGTSVSDPKDEYDQAQQEKQTKLRNDVNNLNPQANLDKALKAAKLKQQALPATQPSEAVN